MKLVLDFGNTLQKLSIFDNNTMIAFKAIRKISLNNLKQFISGYQITSAILSSVIEYPQEINQYLNDNYKFIFFSETTPIPITNNYSTPESLGKDRLAAIVAGNNIFPENSVIVINAGTCITYDFIDNKSVYYGGAISPGINIRFKSLHTFTDKLPLVLKKQHNHLTGDSTVNSILSGVMNGIKAEIEGIISEYSNKNSDLKVILSGGDMKYFDKKIKNSIFAFPNIVLFGLNIILDFNAKK